MRALFIAAAALAGGCMDSTKPVTEDPSGCAMSTSLAANAPTQIGPLDNANVCLHLDATGLVRPHFVATTTAEAGGSSAFTLSLTDVDGTVLRDGWDVTVGDDSPETRASLEWDVPSLSKDIVLELRGTALTQLHVQLFERGE